MKHRIGLMYCVILFAVFALLQGCAQGPMAPSRFGTNSASAPRAESVDPPPAPAGEPAISQPVPAASWSEAKPSFFPASVFLQGKCRFF